MSEPNKHFYFAYGMNTDPEQMEFRTKTSIPIGKAIVRDHGFRFCLYADVYPNKGTDVNGVLWEIDDNGLEMLDYREGFPYYYDRKMVEVECNGRLYTAWMYFMTKDQPERVPSNYYYSMLLRGYIVFGVPMLQMNDAYHRSLNSEASLLSENDYVKMRDQIVFKN